MTRGSATIESLVLGVVVAAAVIHASVTGIRLHHAGSVAESAAHAAAQAAARWGDVATAHRVATRLAPGSQVSVARATDHFSVSVTIEVPIMGDGFPAAHVTGRAVTGISAYRSAR